MLSSRGMAQATNRQNTPIRWYDEETENVGSAAFNVATGLRDDQSVRVAQSRLYSSMYCGETTVIQGTEASYTPDTLTLNVSRSAVDTVHAEIAGRQKPMAKFQTSGADWKTKRRAKKLERFVFGCMSLRQGMYQSAWELMESCFRDAGIFGAGLAKVSWVSAEKGSRGSIKIERAFDFELFVDEAESRYGSPKNLFQLHIMDKDLALWKFAEDPSLELTEEERVMRSEAIRGADSAKTEDLYFGESTTRYRAVSMIRVVEAWKLPSPGRPGRHVIGVSGATLLDEEWTRKRFPFVRICWSRKPIGWFSTGLIEEGENIAKELNENTDRIQERVRLCSGRRVYFHEGSIDSQYLQQNDAEVHIPYTGDKPPVEINSNPLTDAEFQYLEWLRNQYYENIGVSQMRSAARKDPGLTAGVAIRTVNDMQTVRFAPKAKAYENAFVDLAHCIIDACKEAAEEKQQIYVDDYDGEIEWSEVDLDEDPFTITVDPASSLPNDPGGRLQMSTELVQMGAISMETFKQLLGWPDLEKEMNYQTAQRRYLEKLIDRMLDEGENDPTVYEDPDEHLLDDAGAVTQVAQAYFDALYNDAPDQCLKMLRQYIVALDQKIQAKAAIQAAAVQQASMAQTGAPAPQPGA